MIKDFKTAVKYCKWCDRKLILNNNRDVERKNFCCRSCISCYTAKYLKGKSTLLKKCVVCNKEFKTYKSQDKIYCSKECYNNKELEYYLEKLDGYIIKFNRAGKRRKFLHVEIAEGVLGRKLKPEECIHHINMIKTDNRKSNLLICSRSYHSWLHERYAKRFAELHLRGGTYES